MKNFNNFKKDKHFQLKDKKYQEFYQSLININDSESVQQSLDILSEIRKKSNYISGKMYDFITKTIEENGLNEPEFTIEEITGEFPNDDIETLKTPYLVYTPYLRNIIKNSMNLNIRNRLNDILDTVENREKIIEKGIEKYPMTNREFDLFKLYRDGKLTMKDFSTKN